MRLLETLGISVIETDKITQDAIILPAHGVALVNSTLSRAERSAVLSRLLATVSEAVFR